MCLVSKHSALHYIHNILWHKIFKEYFKSGHNSCIVCIATFSGFLHVSHEGEKKQQLFIGKTVTTPPTSQSDAFSFCYYLVGFGPRGHFCKKT